MGKGILFWLIALAKDEVTERIRRQRIEFAI
jgi:hypothetical protein